MMKCHGGPNEVFFCACVFLCGVQLLHIVHSPLTFLVTTKRWWEIKDVLSEA